MTAPISRFFAPRKAPAVKERKVTTRQPKVENDGWQKPIGLTVKHAIEIDSDGEEEQCKDTSSSPSCQEENPVTDSDLGAFCSESKMKVSECSAAIEIDDSDGEGEQASSTSRQEESPIHSTELDPDSKEQKMDASKCSSAIIDLCSPQSSALHIKDTGSSIDAKPEASDANNATKTNPFLQFAHEIGDSESSYFTALKSASAIAAEPGVCPPKKNCLKRDAQPTKTKCSSKKKRPISKADDCEFSEKTEEELGVCRRKWQSFADDDASIEIRRFQVLVAARVHCQAQDPTVRKAMLALRNFFRKPAQSQAEKNNEDEQGESQGDTTSRACMYLSPETLSTADPEELSKLISSVLFANVKSKQIVQASKEVKYQFYGKVPESINSLKSITGIGPKLAELLFHVNSYAAHEQELTRKSLEEKTNIDK